MSYTHTLSIQGVHATLQMNVEHSVVRYTLTLRGDSGEEVVTHGQLPNDAMDHFMVINQYVKNPISVTTSEQGVQANLEQSVKDHIITDVFDFITQGQQAFLQANMAAAQSSSESPPKHEDDTSSAQHCSGQELREQYGFPSGSSEKPLESVSTPFSELSVMEQLQKLREYSNPDIKNGIVQAVQDYLSENNVNLLDYCTLCEFVKELFYEMIVLHVDDNALVGKFIKMLYLAGEQSHTVSQFMSRMWRKYELFCKVAEHHKLTLDSTSFAAYQKWNETYDGPKVDRWNRMKTFLLQ
jgi:hypothetical protein